MGADIAPTLAPETDLRVRHRCRFNGGRRRESANVYSDDLPSRSAWKIVPASSWGEVIGSLIEGEVGLEQSDERSGSVNAHAGGRAIVGWRNSSSDWTTDD